MKWGGIGGGIEMARYHFQGQAFILAMLKLWFLLVEI